MSGFSLHPNESAGLLETRVGDPETRDEAPPPGFFAGSLTATGHGLLAAGANTRAAVDTLSNQLPDAFFDDDDNVLARTEAEKQFGGIRASNRPNPAAMGAMLQDLRPDPQTTGTLGQVTYGLTSILPPAIVGGAVAGPLGAAGAVGATTGVGDYQTNLADGLDASTAEQKALLTGGVNAVGAVLPASLGSTILSRIGSGVALNVPLGMAQRGATSKILRDNGYTEMADQYKAFDGTDILIDAVAGAAFGALPGHGEQGAKEGPPPPEGAAPPSSEAPPSAIPPAADDTNGVNNMAPAERVLPSDIDLSLAANAMNQFELDAAPGIPTTPADRNTHVKAMDTAYGQLMRDEPVDVSAFNHGEMLPKPENNPMDMAINEALSEGGYDTLLQDAAALRDQAAEQRVPLGEDLVQPPISLDTGDLYQRAVDLHSMSPESHSFYDQAAAIRQLVAEGQRVRSNFQLFNRNSPNEVQRLTNWPDRPVPLLDWVKQAGGIMSGLSKDEAADMRARGVKLTDYYTSDVKALFEGRKKFMNNFVKHDGLSLEDDLPSMAAEQGYLGEELMSDEYRQAHPEEAQQKLYAALKKGIAGKPTYDYRVENALGQALAENEAKAGIDKADAADNWMDELNKHGLPGKEATVPQIAEALARRQQALDAQAAVEAARPPSTRPYEEYDGIPFMRAPEVQAAFPRPVDEQDVNPLGFYSQLSRVAHTKLPGRGEGKDFAKALDAYAKNGDFKPEELEYSGVKEWLSTKEKVSKGEVLDFLKNGGVKLEEVILERKVEMVPDRTSYSIRRNYGEYNIVDDSRGVAVESFDNEDEALAVLPEYLTGMEKKVTDDTKYSKWTLPGGENYREVLLTLPSKERGLDEIAQEMFGHTFNELGGGPSAQVMNAQRAERGIPFKSGHWDQPNVLAHFRLADHTDAEGNKVLLIEEIQSDWHQAGRKKGYRKEGQKVDQTFAKNFFGIADADWNAMPEEQRQGYVDEIAEGDTHIRQGMADMVPDAPFKKTWAELSVKRILRMAAEKGYQKVGWVTGEMQADRYDLSKQVDNISYIKQDDGNYRLLVEKDGSHLRAPQLESVAPDKLEEVVGKNVAEKILNGEGQNMAELGHEGVEEDGSIVPSKAMRLAGVDLKVGGEGMKGFYDDILPKTVGKVIGKLDKVSTVGSVKLRGVNEEGHKYEVVTPSGKVMHSTNSLQEAETHAGILQGKVREAGENTVKVHGFDMTDELRDRVMMGMPQFFRASGGKLPENLERLAPGLAAQAPEGMSADDYMVAQQVNTTVARMLPGAEVRMAGKLFSTGEAGAAGEVFGAYHRPLNVRESRGVVDWSLAAPDAEGVARHEVLHGLKETGLFKPEEWETLTTAAKAEDWAGEAKLAEGYTEGQRLEEGIAEKFRIWRRETPEKQVSGVSDVVYKAFARLERLLARVGGMARHYMGMKPTTDDVFSRIERGEVGKREPTAPGAAEKPQHPITQAEQILADKPDLLIPDEDGGMVDGKLAMTDASADAIRAEQHGPLYEVAVNCFLRGM